MKLTEKDGVYYCADHDDKLLKLVYDDEEDKYYLECPTDKERVGVNTKELKKHHTQLIPES